jgi:hypothetical protein
VGSLNSARIAPASNFDCPKGLPAEIDDHLSVRVFQLTLGRTLDSDSIGEAQVLCWIFTRQ